MTSVPRRMRSVAAAAAVSVGTAPNHVSSRSDRQARWSYVHAWSNSSASARRHTPRAVAHGSSGRITTPKRTMRRLRHEDDAADGEAALDVGVSRGSVGERERAIDHDAQVAGGNVVDVAADHLP